MVLIFNFYLLIDTNYASQKVILEQDYAISYI